MNYKILNWRLFKFKYLTRNSKIVTRNSKIVTRNSKIVTQNV